MRVQVLCRAERFRQAEPGRRYREVLSRFDLRGLIRPFSRCVRCNSLLEAVAKREVQRDLPPMTRRHCQNFHRCGGCGALYWRGAHAAALDEWLGGISASSQTV